MFLSPSILLFTLRILLRIIMIISSPSLFIRWVGLELNTLAFIPLLLNIKNKLTSEASIKYFLTQTLASILFILGLLINLTNSGVIWTLFLFLGLSIKLGAAPFHSWLLTVAESCSWVLLLILLTIQKINPLLIVWFSGRHTNNFNILLIFISVLVGGFIGLIQTSSRLVLTFSSINHLGWLLSSLMFNLWLGVVYFSIYFLVLIPVVNFFQKKNVHHINQLPSLNTGRLRLGLLLIRLISLGGLPPFLGFLPKWVVLQSLVSSGYFIQALVMVFISLFTLYYYLRLTFSAFILRKSIVYLSYNKWINLTIFDAFFLSISLLGLPVIFLI